MKRIFLSALLLGLAVAASAADISGTLTVNWVPPVLNTDGTAATGQFAVTSYKVYVDTAAIPDAPTVAPVVTVGTGVTTATYSATVASGSKVHARVQACNQYACGALSADASNTVTGAAPGVPTNVTIAITIKTS